MSKRKLFYIGLGLPFLILIGMTVKPFLAVSVGEEIVLQTKPYDPRDLLYGDYVILSYEIEDIPFSLLDNKAKSQIKRGAFESDAVYLSLQENNQGIHTVEKVSIEKPSSGIYLTVKDDIYTDEENGQLTVQLPFNKYYVKENTGKELEESSQEGKLEVTLGVRQGYGIIEDISLEKER